MLKSEFGERGRNQEATQQPLANVLLADTDASLMAAFDPERTLFSSRSARALHAAVQQPLRGKLTFETEIRSMKSSNLFGAEPEELKPTITPLPSGMTPALKRSVWVPKTAGVLRNAATAGAAPVALLTRLTRPLARTPAEN